jgi:hypothetical protein
VADDADLDSVAEYEYVYSTQKMLGDGSNQAHSLSTTHNTHSTTSDTHFTASNTYLTTSNIHSTMAEERTNKAAAAISYHPRNRANLKIALDALQHASLALVGDKVLDLLVVLAFYHSRGPDGMSCSHIPSIR